MSADEAVPGLAVVQRMVIAILAQRQDPYHQENMRAMFGDGGFGTMQVIVPPAAQASMDVEHERVDDEVRITVVFTRKVLRDILASENRHTYYAAAARVLMTELGKVLADEKGR